MTDSSGADIDADDLLPNERLRQQVLSGEVRQIHRGAGRQYAEEGDVFAVDGVPFEVTDVADRTLGDLTDADARREGADSLEAYRERLERVHGGDFEWDDSSPVVRYQFERIGK